MNRAAQFFRSVLPADLFQLCFLAGIACLTIAPHLRWWPAADWPSKFYGSSVWMEYYTVRVVATFGFIFASSAGYFLCFWPGKQVKAKVWLVVFLPALVSVALTAVKFL